MNEPTNEARASCGRCRNEGSGLLGRRDEVGKDGHGVPACPCRAWFGDAARQARILRKRMRMCW